MAYSYELHGIVCTDDFNFDAIDRKLIDENPDQPECQELKRLLSDDERCREIATGVKLFLENLIPKSFNASTPQAMGLQLITILWMLGSKKNYIGEVSLATIAKRLGVTRAILSHYAKRHEKTFRIHARGMKQASSSETFSKAGQKAWRESPQAARRRKAALLAAGEQAPTVPPDEEETDTIPLDDCPVPVGRKLILHDEEAWSSECAERFSFE